MDVIRPSFTWLRLASPRFDRIRHNRQPEFFETMAEHGAARGLRPPNFENSLALMTKVLAHTGVPVHQLLPGHLLEYRDYRTGRGQKPDGLTYAWSTLQNLGVFGASTPGLLQAVAGKRPSVEEMVDSYGPRSRSVRDMLVRYLKTREASVDYSTLRWLVYELVKIFWLDIEAHNPEADSLNIGFDEGRAWLSRFMQGPISTKHRTLFRSVACIWTSLHGLPTTRTGPSGRHRLFSRVKIRRELPNTNGEHRPGSVKRSGTWAACCRSCWQAKTRN